MTTDYNATIEVNHRADAVTADQVDQLMDTLAPYHATVGGSPRGWLEVTLTVPAENLTQASTTALSVVQHAMHQVGPTAAAIAAEVLTTEEFDKRADMVPMPSLIGTAEAAEILGVSEQRVGQLVHAGQLSAAKVGRSLALSRTEVERFAGRERRTGRPRKSPMPA